MSKKTQRKYETKGLGGIRIIRKEKQKNNSNEKTKKTERAKTEKQINK